jgi:hypothetical protein
MPVRTQTLYEVLMVDPGVDADVLAAVYRRHVQRMLATPSGGGAADMLRLRALEQAYEVLRDPERRQRYDVELGLRARRAAWRSQPDAPVAPAKEAAPAASPAPRPSASTARTGVLDFGRYAGWSLRQIAMRDRDYLEWLRRTPGGRQYQTEIATILDRR